MSWPMAMRVSSESLTAAQAISLIVPSWARVLKSRQIPSAPAMKSCTCRRQDHEADEQRV